MALKFFSLLFLFSSVSAWGIPQYLHKTPDICRLLLEVPEVRLSDLISAQIVEPDSSYLHSPRQDVDDHEYKTAQLLAERLKQPVALLPRLTRTMNVPAVDGTIFDGDGAPVSNFSLKTFFPSEGPGRDLNHKLLNTMRTARQSIHRNYTVTKWSEIIRRQMSPRVRPQDCDLECRTYHKIFGLTESGARPVSIVIDYTLDPTAIFRLQMWGAGKNPEIYLTLNAHDRGINMLHLMKRIGEQSIVKEYIFLGAHHLLRVHGQGYQMTEYCDGFGHSH